MSEIAVLMPNWVGDLVMALSVVQRKAERSRDPMTLIVPPRLEELARALSALPCIPCPRATRREFSDSVAMVRKRGFDKLYILPRSLSSAFFGWKTRIPFRRGVRGELRSALLTDRLPRSIASRSRHLTYEYSSVLDAPYEEPLWWKGPSLPADKAFAGAIVLCPGAAYGPSKQWRGFSELIRRHPDRNFVILGDARDKKVSLDLDLSIRPRVHDLTGGTTLLQAAAIIAGASAVVANDSGLMHLAGFLGVPLVAVFGSTSPAWTRPLGSKVRVACRSLPCAPCYKRKCPKGHYRCLREIGADTVASLLDEVLR